MLDRVAVDPRRQLERGDVGNLVRRQDPRAQARRVGEILARGEMAGVAHPVPGAAVHEAGIAGDVGHRVAGRDVAAAVPDHDRDLALVVELLAVRRDDDGRVVGDETVREAAHQVRVDQFRPSLRDPRAFVIEQHLDDLGRPVDGGEQRDLVEAQVRRPPAAASRSVARFRERQRRRDGQARVSEAIRKIEDARPHDGAEAGPPRMHEIRQLHRESGL